MTWTCCRHGAMPDLFGGIEAPSTLGSRLRCYTWGNVRQLEKAHREFLTQLLGRAPLIPRRPRSSILRRARPPARNRGQAAGTVKRQTACAPVTVDDTKRHPRRHASSVSKIEG